VTEPNEFDEFRRRVAREERRRRILVRVLDVLTALALLAIAALILKRILY
jgi:type IV secretory pathway component VirB8